MVDTTTGREQKPHWGVRLSAWVGAVLCSLTLLLGSLELVNAILIPVSGLAAGLAVLYTPFTFAGLFLTGIASRQMVRPLRSTATGKVVMFAVCAGVFAFVVSFGAILAEHRGARDFAYDRASPLRTIVTANVIYVDMYPKIGFAKELSNLSGHLPCDPTPETSCLIDQPLASGHKSGYIYTYVSVADKDGVNRRFWVRADPDESMVRQGEDTSYFTDQTGVIRVEKGRPATAESRPLN